MDEFRDREDEPEHGDEPDEPEGVDRIGGQDRPGRPGERRLAVGGDTETLEARVEGRSRTEYAADLKQRVVSGWPQRPFTPRMEAPTAVPDSVPADVADRPRDPERSADPLEVVRRFEPKRAGLPDISAKDAVTYIEARCGDRPWLAAARDAPPEVQRLFAALDQGGQAHRKFRGRNDRVRVRPHQRAKRV